MRGSFATDLAACLLAFPVSLFPLVNELRFGGDPRTTGFFLSAIAVGGLAVGLFSGSVTRVALVSGGLAATAGVAWVGLTNRPLRTYRPPDDDRRDP